MDIRLNSLNKTIVNCRKCPRLVKFVNKVSTEKRKQNINEIYWGKPVPGFGDPDGSYAVLEVKTNELPFILEDGQTIARIKYEKLNKKTSVVYGSTINSNYQNQKLALSKHFKQKKKNEKNTHN